MKDRLLKNESLFSEPILAETLFTREVSLNDWIVQFAPNQCKNICTDVLKSAGFSESTISFTHFSRVFDLVLCHSRKGLEFMYNRACAVVLPINHKGAEYLIPCRSVKKGKVSYQGLLVQLKTFSDKTVDREYPASAAYKLSGDFVFEKEKSFNSSINHDFFGLYLVLKNISTKTPTKDEEPVEHWNMAKYTSYEMNSKKKSIEYKPLSDYNCLAIRTLKSPLYSNEIDECLASVLASYNSPLDCIPDLTQRQDIAEQLKPWVRPLLSETAKYNKKRKLNRLKLAETTHSKKPKI
jgi:hypothetical protein